MTVNQAVGTQGHCLSRGRELLSTGQPGLRWRVPGAVEPSKALWPRMFPHGARPHARLLVHPADTEVGRHSDKKATLAGQRVPGPCRGAQAQLRESGIQCPNFPCHMGDGDVGDYRPSELSEAGVEVNKNSWWHLCSLQLSPLFLAFMWHY